MRDHRDSRRVEDDGGRKEEEYAREAQCETNGKGEIGSARRRKPRVVCLCGKKKPLVIYLI